MSEATIALIMDGLILILLAITIYSAARLSLLLKTFRDSRKDLSKLLKDLSKQIILADKAIVNLRDTARESGVNLQSLINDSRALSQELDLMIGSGNGLAERLAAARGVSLDDEKLDENKNKNKSDVVDFDKSVKRTKVTGPANATSRDSVQSPARKESSPFMIRDRDIDRGEADNGNIGNDLPESDNLKSRAEKELYEALMGKGGPRAAGSGRRK